jgi:gliding motility-associated lipoprotein GldH
MKKIAFVSVLAALTLTACTEGYQESHKDIFNDQVWTKGEVITYHPVIHENEKSHAISVDLQHIYGYDIDALNVKVSIVAPSGATELEKEYAILYKDAAGKALSQCSGDYCDVQQVLESAYQFKEQGEYTIKFEQNTHAESVAGFLSLKLLIK